jgi:Kdo2-lipid IVA lauroyltransferase/acyltransferase
MKLFITFLAKYLPFIIDFILWKLRVVLEYVLRYRSKVIFQNLKNAFSKEKSIQEIKHIKHQYYGVLLRYIREALYKSVWETSKIRQSLKIEDSEKWNHFFQQNKGVIVLASHSGNWEFNLPVLPIFVASEVIAFYKPISNQRINKVMFQLRSKFGMKNYPIEQTARIMAKYKDQNALFLFVGDQSPLNMNGVHWNTFLHQDTPWLTGAEKLAIRYKMPVVYLEQIPMSGSETWLYTIQFHLISSDASKTKTGEITQKYTEILEQEIRQRPAYWLWSHRRWKRSHLKP